jgi:hypothetical protein
MPKLMVCCLHDGDDDDNDNDGDGNSNDKTHLGRIRLGDDTANKRNYITFISFHLYKLKSSS